MYLVNFKIQSEKNGYFIWIQKYKATLKCSYASLELLWVNNPYVA